MCKRWLMCVLLGTLAWGQAAPSAPASPQPAQAPADTSASVPADAAVITIIGVCPPQPKPAAAKSTAAKPATPAKSADAKTPAADCKTVITKAQFEKIASSVAPNFTPQVKKQLQGVLPRFIGISSQAKKQGMDKTEQFKQTVEFAKMQILTTELQRKIQDDAAKVPPEEMEKYYKEHPETYEQFNMDRLFVPRNKQPEAESKEDEAKDEKLSDEAKKAKEAEEKAKTEAGEQEMTKLAETLRTRAAAGEDFIKLQKEAFEAAGMKIESPTINLPSVRRTALPPAHSAVFELKPGEVSQVIGDAGGHYVYKMNSKELLPMDQVTSEIHNKLQGDRTREMMDKLNNSFKVETNEAYFGPGGPATPAPPRMPRPRPMGAPPAAQPQTPPPAQPPAAKPN